MEIRLFRFWADGEYRKKTEKHTKRGEGYRPITESSDGNGCT
jgi:hypothetical protein